MSIKIIVAVDSNFGIGYKNDLLFKISEDMKHFKKLTTGHFVVMGRKTYESLPSALPNRTNVVLTNDKNFKTRENSTIIESNIEKIVNHYRTGKQEKHLFIIGGETIYNQFLPFASEVHLTMVHKEAENVDTYFPIEKVSEQGFRLKESRRSFSDEYDCKLTFITYEKPVKVT